jgi:hypothetical protein
LSNCPKINLEKDLNLDKKGKKGKKMGATISSYFADPFDVSSPDAEPRNEEQNEKEREMIANKRIEYFQKRSENRSKKSSTSNQTMSLRKKVDPDDVVRDWCN